MRWRSCLGTSGGWRSCNAMSAAGSSKVESCMSRYRHRTSLNHSVGSSTRTVVLGVLRAALGESVLNDRAGRVR